MRNQGLSLVRCLALGLLFLLPACQKEAPQEPVAERRAQKNRPGALEPEFLERALTALGQKVGPEIHTLELRAEAGQLSLQVEMAGKMMQVDYVERSTGGARESRIVGPDPIELRGDGGLEDNLFVLSEIDVQGIAKSFKVAKRAVDPIDGRVVRLIVRRFLPFTTKIRARIYVDSPRMSGSIDTNEIGVPLKKR